MSARDPHTNPYRTSDAPHEPVDGAGVVRRSTGLLTASVALAIIASVAALGAAAVLARFRELFEGFGADLPLISQLALEGAWLWWLIAALAIALCVGIARTPAGSRARLRRMRLALIACVVAMSVAVAVTYFALYLPIFSLGQVV